MDFKQRLDGMVEWVYDTHKHCYYKIIEDILSIELPDIKTNI